MTSPLRHPYGCVCPSCAYYAAAVLHAAEFSSPYALAQQYAFEPPFSPARHRAEPTAEEACAALSSATGRVVEFISTHEGRTFAVHALKARGGSIAPSLMEEILPRIAEVAVDVHGAHVARAVVEHLPDAQCQRIVDVFVDMDPRAVLNLATSSQHSRKFLEHLLSNRRLALSRLEDVLIMNTPYLAVSQQGCIALMHEIKVTDESRRLAIAHEVLPSAPTLAQDAFGNYVVQALLETGEHAIVGDIVAKLKGRIGTLACNKFASNVLEKALRTAGGAARRLLVEELVFSDQVHHLMADQYGNFVIQAVIATAKNSGETRRIGDKLKPLIPGCPYGPKIEAKLKATRKQIVAGVDKLPLSPASLETQALPTPFPQPSFA